MTRQEMGYQEGREALKAGMCNSLVDEIIEAYCKAKNALRDQDNLAGTAYLGQTVGLLRALYLVDEKTALAMAENRGFTLGQIQPLAASQAMNARIVREGA
jgi:hypothetical protein